MTLRVNNLTGFGVIPAPAVSYVYTGSFTAGADSTYTGLYSGYIGSVVVQPVPSYTLTWLYHDSAGDDKIRFSTNINSVLGSMSLYIDNVLIDTLATITTEKKIVGMPVFTNGQTYTIGFA